MAWSGVVSNSNSVGLPGAQRQGQDRLSRARHMCLALPAKASSLPSVLRLRWLCMEFLPSQTYSGHRSPGLALGDQGWPPIRVLGQHV